MRLKSLYFNAFYVSSILLLTLLLSNKTVASNATSEPNNSSRPKNALYILTIIKALFGDGFVDEDEMARQIKEVRLEQSNLDSNITDCSEDILKEYTDCCHNNEPVCQGFNGSSICYCSQLTQSLETTTRSGNYFKQNKKEMSTSLIILSIGLPTLSILMLICTIFSITWCRKPTASSADSRQLTQNDHTNISISNLTDVYNDLDKKSSREPPPNYSEVFKSSIVDKLPTYKSFREKRFFDKKP